MVDKKAVESVLGLFLREVQQIVEEIERLLAADNKEESLFWANELLAIRDSWAEIAARPGGNIDDWTGRGAVIDKTESKRLANLRLKTVSAVLARLQKKFQAKGWL